MWTRRERLRTFRGHAAAAPVLVMADGAEAPPVREAGLDARPPPFGYRWVTQAYGLCPPCHAEITGGGDMLDHDRRKALLTCFAVAALVVILWEGFVPFTHNWIAAFWRNGAGGF